MVGKILLVLVIGLASFGPLEVFGQRIPPPPPQLNINPNGPPPPNIPKNAPGININQQQPQQPQNGSMNLQLMQLQQKTEELANVKDENIKRVLLELSTLLTPSQTAETLARVAQLVGPLFYKDFDRRKDQIVVQGRNASQFPQRLLSAFTDIQGEEVKALLLQKNLESLHAADFGFLPMAIHYALQDSVLRNVSGTKLASAVKVNRGDTTIAFKTTEALNGNRDQQIEFLQSLGNKILPDVQKIIIRQVLSWWGNPNQWKDRELSLLTSSGDPLLAYLPPSTLETLDDELADRFTSTLGQSSEIGKVWWMKPMSLKKAWFELAKGARYFGAVHEWSFRRMQKLSFLLEGAAPEDLELIPPIPEIKGLVIGNHYTELQARVVFDAFYKKAPLSQEELQEFQFHILDLIPSQLQRFDLADSFSTLDDMIAILEAQRNPSFPTLLQISNFMWPLINTTSGLTIAPPNTWQKRELSQMGKMLFLLPKSTLFQIPPELINWDSNTLQAIRSTHLSRFQTWYLTSQILSSIDERFKPDYVFLIPAPFQKGIPTQNISQVLLGSPLVRPEVLRALIEESSGMLTSQQAVIVQRIRHRLSEATIIRNILSSSNPSDLFNFFSPRQISKTIPTIIKTIMEMPESGRFGITSIQAKLLPQQVLSLWLNWVREQAQVTRWTAEDLLGRSPLGATHSVQLAILGLSCRDVKLVDPLDILPVILHYRHELYALRNFKSELNFRLNLRPCLLEKVLEYLKIKINLNDNQNDSHILASLNPGEISGIGGEILTMIPLNVLQVLPINTRVNIIEEIGSLEMLDLFRLVSLEQIRWYGNTLLRDMQDQKVQSPGRIQRKRQADDDSNNNTMIITPSDEVPSANDSKTIGPTINSTDDSTTSGSTTSSTETAIVEDTREVQDPGQDSVAAVAAAAFPDVQQQLTLDTDSIQKMGNLLCYADDVFIGNWSTQFLKDTLESKTFPGEKTCCMTNSMRTKWFSLLQTAYGFDTSSWTEFDLASIGDLLIAVPESDLQKISQDALAKAVSPVIKQSGFDVKIMVPGVTKKTRFVTLCADALGSEGFDFIAVYKTLMKELSQAAQWMVDTVKTTDELIKGSVGRTGRLPRWAEFKVVRKPRQVPMPTGPTSTSPGGAMAPGFQSMKIQQGSQSNSPMMPNPPMIRQPTIQQRPGPSGSPGMGAQGSQMPVASLSMQNQGSQMPVASLSTQNQGSQMPMASLSMQNQGSQMPVASLSKQNQGSQMMQSSLIPKKNAPVPTTPTSLAQRSLGIPQQSSPLNTAEGFGSPGQFSNQQVQPISGRMSSSSFPVQSGIIPSQFDASQNQFSQTQGQGNLPGQQGGTIFFGQDGAEGQQGQLGQQQPGFGLQKQKGSAQGQFDQKQQGYDQDPFGQQKGYYQGFDQKQQGYDQGQYSQQKGYDQGQYSQQKGYDQGQYSQQKGYNQGQQQTGYNPGQQQAGYDQGQYSQQKGYDQGQYSQQKGYDQGQYSQQKGYDQGQYSQQKGYNPGQQQTGYYQGQQQAGYTQGQQQIGYNQGQQQKGYDQGQQQKGYDQGQFGQQKGFGTGLSGQSQQGFDQGQSGQLQQGFGQGRFGLQQQGLDQDQFGQQKGFGTGLSVQPQQQGFGQGQFGQQQQGFDQGRFGQQQDFGVGLSGQSQLQGFGQGQFGQQQQGFDQSRFGQQQDFGVGLSGQSQLQGFDQGQSGQQQGFGQGQFGQQQGFGQGQFGQQQQGLDQGRFGQQQDFGTGLSGQSQQQGFGQGQFGQQQQGFGQGQFGQQQQGFGQGQTDGSFGNSDQTLDLTGRSVGDNTTSTTTGKNVTGTNDTTTDLQQRALDSDSVGQLSGINCNGIKAAGPAAIGLTIEDLQGLSSVELFDCIETLGRIEWDDDTKAGLVSVITEKLSLTTDNLNTLTLIELGDLVTALAVGSDLSLAFISANGNTTLDISKMDLTLPGSLDILSILGSQITKPSVLKALSEKFNADNRIFPGFSQGIARPENLRIAVLALGNIICGFSDKIVNSIFESDASLFIDTSPMLGKLEGCSMEVLTTLATHAVRPSNYGQPRLWSQEDLETIGVVFAGLKPDAISTIPSESMQGLQPHAIKSLPTSSFLALSPEQVSRMSYGAATSVLPTQINSLTPHQLDALQGVVQLQHSEFDIEITATTPNPDDIRLETARALPPSETAPNATNTSGPPNVHGRAHFDPNDDSTLPEDGVPPEDNPEADANSTTTTTTSTTTETPTPAPSISVKISPALSFTLFVSVTSYILSGNL